MSGAGLSSAGLNRPDAGGANAGGASAPETANGSAVRTDSWGVRHLTVRYGKRTVLRDVDLTAAAGSVTAVIGGDGAGKSTLLRTLAGGRAASAGEVRRPGRRRIGYVAGVSGIYDDLSVAENIAFMAAAYGVRGNDLARRTRDLMERTGLRGAETRLAGRLSGGMHQKLAFALAMLHGPELLILDEPTSGVDPVSRAELWGMIAAAAAGGAAIVVATTYMDEAERASAVVVLDDGRVAASGGPEVVSADVRSAAATTQATVAQTGGATLAAAHGVTRRFGRFTAVAGVDLTVGAGEVVGLLGANGAGKTTLIRMLLGLVRPSAGAVELFGAAPSRETRGRLGYVPQGLGLWEDLTVAENLAFSASAFGREAPALEPDLEAESGTLVRDLPLGLRRRLAFAAALAHGPGLLVLDEPTSGVDPRARARLWETVHAAAARGAGVLVTTHHLEEAKECDRLVMLSAGRVVAQGRLAEIVGDRMTVAVTTLDWAAAYTALASAGLPAALVGRDLRVPGSDVPRVEAALAAAGIDTGLSSVPATFEETFVDLARGGETRQTADTTERTST
ncbi:MAG TPA: ATP-binding cassette domain-containing protein [Thermoleophilia bacterium]|nr:ATP-binding cassette domain-containing protein [Thermoleophilia bacterium]